MRMGVSVGSLLFSVAVFLSPVYLFPSGLPQPADLVFLLFAGYVVFNALHVRHVVRLPGFFILWGGSLSYGFPSLRCRGL